MGFTKRKFSPSLAILAFVADVEFMALPFTLTRNEEIFEAPVLLNTIELLPFNSCIVDFTHKFLSTSVISLLLSLTICGFPICLSQGLAITSKFLFGLPAKSTI